VPLWWLWVVQTYTADRVADDRTGYRLLGLLGLLAVGGVATAVPGVPGPGNTLSVGCYLLGRAVPALLYLRHVRHVRRIAVGYTAATVVAALPWLGGYFSTRRGVTSAGRWPFWWSWRRRS